LPITPEKILAAVEERRRINDEGRTVPDDLVLRPSSFVSGGAQ
jgi:hypothetical protein